MHIKNLLKPIYSVNAPGKCNIVAFVTTNVETNFTFFFHFVMLGSVVFVSSSLFRVRNYSNWCTTQQYIENIFKFMKNFFLRFAQSFIVYLFVCLFLCILFYVQAWFPCDFINIYFFVYLKALDIYLWILNIHFCFTIFLSFYGIMCQEVNNVIHGGMDKEFIYKIGIIIYITATSKIFVYILSMSIIFLWIRQKHFKYPKMYQQYFN